MSRRVLITGGAGFIGSHLADELLAHGYRVRILDNLLPQVHQTQAAPPHDRHDGYAGNGHTNGSYKGSYQNGSNGDSANAGGHGGTAPTTATNGTATNGVVNGNAAGDLARPEYLHADVELMHGDICDARAVQAACHDVELVYHFAARVGVGQSMYQIADYTYTNNQGTAVLLEELAQRPVARLVVASSMSIYGEGLYRTADGAVVAGAPRTLAQLKAGQWELTDAAGRPLTPMPTPESKQPALASVYALSKFDQEQMCMMVGRAYNIPTVALRFFNVYGTRQALSNPYTGVLAIFAARLLNNHAPTIYEDGQQMRDFVNVADVAQACRLAAEVPGAADQVFNVGSGQAYSVCEIARRLAETLDKPDIQPEILGKYRVGDIRHCFADISHARQVLGYAPQVTLAAGLRDYAAWLCNQLAVDQVVAANQELRARGLTV